jgi:hypothetical protein
VVAAQQVLLRRADLLVEAHGLGIAALVAQQRGADPAQLQQLRAVRVPPGPLGVDVEREPLALRPGAGVAQPADAVDDQRAHRLLAAVLRAGHRQVRPDQVELRPGARVVDVVAFREAGEDQVHLVARLPQVLRAHPLPDDPLQQRVHVHPAAGQVRSQQA